MKLTSYLSFDGNAREAFDFYADLLGGKVTAMITYGETPCSDQVSPSAHGLITHGCLEIGDQNLMACDATPEHPYRGVTGAYVTIFVDEPAEAERIFAGLAEGGKVEMPIGETFFAKRFGMTVDRFGIPWMVLGGEQEGCGE